MKALIEQARHINAFTSFLVKAFLFYIGWWLLYHLVIMPGRLDEWVIDLQVRTSGALLEQAGYAVRYKDFFNQQFLDTLWIPGSKRGLRVAEACDSIDLMGLYAVFILSYPGKWLHRAIFAAGGLLIIHFLNVLRIAALVVIQFNNPSLLEFNHKYTFTGLMYLCIFGMWYFWVKLHKRGT